MELKQIKQIADKVRDNVGKVVIGKDDVTEKLLIALIVSGHVLLEDVPGTGKTVLAKTMANSLKCQFKRIQFTPDLLPSDLSGINFFNQKSSEFEFRPGPLFTNVLLADEINRATPRTQSSLLECMEERQVSIDGHTHKLDRPFLVIATQNPIENQGTFPLPEAQMDRFLFKVKMGYPTEQEGVDILYRFKEANPIETLESVATVEEIVAMQDKYSAVRIERELMEYMMKIAVKTREHTDTAMGVSPRGSLALLRAVQVKAILSGRDYVTPDDVKQMIPSVFAHRLVLKQSLRSKGTVAEDILNSIMKDVPVPAEDKLATG